MEVKEINFPPIGGVSTETVGRCLPRWPMEVVQIVADYTMTLTNPLFVSYEPDSHPSAWCRACGARGRNYLMQIGNQPEIDDYGQYWGCCLDCFRTIEDPSRGVLVKKVDDEKELMVMQLVHVLQHDLPVMIAGRQPARAKIGPLCIVFVRYDGRRLKFGEISMITNLRTVEFLSLNMTKLRHPSQGECFLCDKKIEKRLFKYIKWKTRKIVNAYLARG